MAEATGPDSSPVAVELPNVSGMEPTLAVPSLGGRLGALEVSLSDVRPLGQDLPVRSDAQLHALHRFADGAEAKGIGAVDGQGGRGLGEGELPGA